MAHHAVFQVLHPLAAFCSDVGTFTSASPWIPGRHLPCMRRVACRASIRGWHRACLANAGPMCSSNGPLIASRNSMVGCCPAICTIRLLNAGYFPEEDGREDFRYNGADKLECYLDKGSAFYNSHGDLVSHLPSCQGPTLSWGRWWRT